MTDYEKLKKLYDEIDNIIKNNVGIDDQQFKIWREKIKRFFVKKYGEKSYEMKKLIDIPFLPACFTMDSPDDEFQEAYIKGLNRTKAYILPILEELEEENNNWKRKSENICITNKTDIFIVHGHNGELKEQVARLIEKQKINAIILHEQANKGATIIEKIEDNSNVGAAICLFTADDKGSAKEDETAQKRARQNVVFETGYFMGKLGRDKVLVVADKGIEIPSDLQGVVRIEESEWKFKILKELKAMGFDIDYNQLD